MSGLRRPAVAGSFYPADPRVLEADVRGYLAGAEEQAVLRPDAPAKALIVPHAGFVYSGPVAASAYLQLVSRRSVIRRVVLLGPSHRVAVRGLAATSADHFETPLGRVAIDREAVERALARPQVGINDEAHAAEHSLEVHLPFLQIVLDDFSLVPFSVGDAAAREIDEVLELLWGGDETLIVVSSDLSHYYPYDHARTLDAETTRAIESLDAGALGRESACGRIPAGGLLLAARRHGLEVRTLDLRNSGDTAGPRDQVVGYGSYAFEPRGSGVGVDADACSDTDATSGGYGAREHELMIDVARRSLETGLREGHGLVVDVPSFPPRLRESRACFVTLHLDGALRGCIGSLEAFRPLIADIADRAYSAGFRDPRFASLSEPEIGSLELDISILSPLEPFPVQGEADLIGRVRPGVDGLVIQMGDARGTLLPAVWESLPDPRTFIRQLKLKAGLPEDYWSPELRFSRFTSETIESPAP